MTRAYLSGPIIHSELRADEFYRIVVKTLEDLGICIFAPQFLPPIEPLQVYERDVTELRMSDFLIAEISNPSIGVGMEIMLAIELKKPILMFHRDDVEKISFMVLGADGSAIFPYSSFEKVREVLTEHDLESLIVHKCIRCVSQVAELFNEDARCISCGTIIEV